jgi:hypothetical protein
MFWTYLWDFLRGLLPAALKAWLAERRRLGEVADKGASDQRAADQAADAKLDEEAGKLREEVHNLTDDQLAERRRKWMR